MSPTRIEREHEHVLSLWKQIKERERALNDAMAALKKFNAEEIVAPFEEIKAGVRLGKIADVDELKKRLQTIKDGLIVKSNEMVSAIQADMGELRHLLAEHDEAITNARDSLPEVIKSAPNARMSLPSGGYFVATKGGGFFRPAPVAKNSVDPLTSLGDVQLARRFQPREQ